MSLFATLKRCLQPESVHVLNEDYIKQTPFLDVIRRNKL